ncbi:MAG: hypothetical protein ACRDT6_24575 [Micromonosporaceae bacterium]
MRTAVRALFALLLAAIVVIVPSPASAGGPTSVMLTAPYLEETASLYHSDPGYGELLSLLGGADGSMSPPEQNAESYESSVFVRVTWLVHDMYVWRIDLIYLDAPGGPRISTRMEPDGREVWHTVKGDRELVRLLDKLGLLTPEARDAATSAPTRSAAAAAPPASPPDRAPDARLWNLYAFLAGVLLTAGAVWLRGRVMRFREPRGLPAPG